VIPRFITAILNGEQPMIYGDGLQSRDFTYVDNVVHGNLLAADRPGVSGMVFNVACGRTTTILDLLDALNRALGTSVKPQFAPPRPGDIRESLADISMARTMLGYAPQIGLLEGIEKSIQYYRTMISIPIPNGS
jgi:UDP-glucose 4-epimerase